MMKKCIKQLFITATITLGFFVGSANSSTNLPPGIYYTVPGFPVIPGPSDFNSYTGIIQTGGNINDNWVLNGASGQSYTITLTDLSPQAGAIQGLGGGVDVSSMTFIGDANVILTGGSADITAPTDGSFQGDGIHYRFSIHPGGKYILASFFSIDVSGYAPEGGTYRIDIVRDVPEPETYAMLIIGLGIIAWVSRRRKDDVQ